MSGSKMFRNSGVRYYVIACCAVLTSVVLAITGMVAAEDRGQQTARKGFDFDKGNAPLEVIFPKTEGQVRQAISPGGGDATLILRVAAMVEVAWFDANAPYHPTAVGIYSNLGRRPKSESATNKNKNIAILYATYRMLNNLLPGQSANWREMMTGVGLNPDDDQENTNTAVGIGNRAARSVIANRVNDGMNQLGNEGGGKYPQAPYADYTGYRPVNSPTKITDPSRWQPAIVTKGNGLFQAQQFVTPQLRLTKPFSYVNPKEFRAPPPGNSDYHDNRRGYKKQADEILAASANLTDEQKMQAEFYNDKFNGLGRVALAGFYKGGGLDQFIERFATANLVGFDTAIAIWNDKYTYDAVRPFSAIHHLYKDRHVTAWGGPGKGRVTDMPGDRWRSYLNVSDHPEYPSGSTSFCAAFAQVGRHFNNSDALGFAQRYPKGSSQVEPGVTPARDLTLRWNTWSDYVRDCGQSRFWGGVHFKSSIAAAEDVGRKVGDRVYEFMQQHISGTAGPRS